MNKSFTKEDILNELDSAGINDPYKFFLDLNHGYFYPSGSRITLFADQNRWVIALEKTGYHNRQLTYSIEINYFGNCLNNLDKVGSDSQYTCNTKFFCLCDGLELKSISDGFELVSNKAEFLRIRNTNLIIEHDLTKYVASGIPKEFDEKGCPQNKIGFVQLIRYFDSQHPAIFRATDQELYSCLPKDLPKIMIIDNFFIEEYAAQFDDSYLGQKPSSYETFQQIADILVSRDIKKWNPTLGPNNHWKNWPLAGQL
jgi:hypothetical protein